jgi:hypothetical protein
MGLWGGAWCAAPAILLVYGGVERPPRSEEFRVLMFQLSLVFFLIQASVQLLVKVPGSWRSEGL